MRVPISIEPFLRWVANESEKDGFRLADTPPILISLGVKAVQPTPKTDPVPEEKNMKLPDVVQTAIRTKLSAEMTPIRDKVQRLRAILDAFEAKAEQDAERRVSNSMLAALGVDLVPDDAGFEVLKKEMQEAMVQVGALMGPVPKEPEPPRTEPELALPASASPSPVTTPAPVTLPTPPVAAAAPPPPPPIIPPAPTRRLRDSDITAAKKLIAEVEKLKLEVKDQHPVRLFPLLQAIVAEVRILQNRLPQDNYLHERVGHLMPIVSVMKTEGKVEEFIHGLARGTSTGNWEHLASSNRRKVEMFDRDVARSARPLDFGTETPKSKRPEKVAPTLNGTTHQWPEYPRLRALSKPILLAGGMIIPEKIKSVRERFGFDVEWHEIDHDSPKASGTLMLRIRAGKVGAVILLEAFMKHSTFKPAVEACNLMKVPYTMGDKAGVASLQQALDELERQLSVACAV